MQQSDKAHAEFARRIQGIVNRDIAPLALAIETSEDFPQAACDACAREKLFSIAMPRSHGGHEAKARDLACMVETISTKSPSAALLVFPTNAVLRTIALTGTDEQKDRFFAELKDGDQPMAFCLTEPGHGSNAAGLQARAVRQGDEYVVSGNKTYITLGPHARYYMTFVRTGPGERADGISALLIPRDAPGLSFGKTERKMGLHGSVTTAMFMDQVRVPVANRLWGEGEGWRVLTEVSNPMRTWGAASMALGAGQGLLDLAREHALKTMEDGRPQMAQQAIGFLLADMKIKVEAARSLIYRVCAMLDSGGHSASEIETMVSAAKCFAADTGMEVADLASQVIGRDMAGTDNLAGCLFKVVKGIQIFDGSNQIQRLVIARNLAKGA